MFDFSLIANYYNNAQLKPKDTSSTVNLWENGVLNKEPLPGQTESSITVIYKSSNDRMEKKRKNTDTQCNKVTNGKLNILNIFKQFSQLSFLKFSTEIDKLYNMFCFK